MQAEAYSCEFKALNRKPLPKLLFVHLTSGPKISLDMPRKKPD